MLMRSKSRSAPDGPNELVRLNIGGHRYLTTSHTLVSAWPALPCSASLSPSARAAGGTNFFSGLLSGQIPSLRVRCGDVCPRARVDRELRPQDDDGYYFVDRDGRLFGVLLDFLRTGRWRVSPCVCPSSALA